MDRDKVLELAREAGFLVDNDVFKWSVGLFKRFAALIEREVRGGAASGDIHSCSYFCHRPECIKAQRDELRDRMESAAVSDAEPVYSNAFLSDVMTAAGLVAHGKQSKALSERLLKDVMRLRAHPAPAVVRQLVKALKAAGLFAHHCWCDVAMNEYSSKKLDETMTEIDAALAAAKEAGL